ncbi:DUF5990 family protein [Sphingomonas sp.]|uniref:DUF5990 family protein n=1 Tax=Sphingomonas sp. TaxID=28214 RepID=UPI000DB04FFF|nr:DUF5990 family protein [Sphingomonas sp.]PZU10830.1 MAG: hypothetical protein DI605_04140 [Sphingomonas sp.]
MARTDRIEIPFRIIIRQPVPNVLHSLQARNGGPLDPKSSPDGAPLRFDFPVRIGPGPKFHGDQVRPEGPVRRFVYIRVGDLAGDAASPWSRRMKIDIHDIDEAMIEHAARSGGVIETIIIGTASDGTPACATITPAERRVAER